MITTPTISSTTTPTTNSTSTSTLPITDIKIGTRHRKNFGDIDALARSIKDLGLLHPPVVTRDNNLVVGVRRLEACRRLGWTEVPVTIANGLTELGLCLRAEAEENTCRLDLAPSEAVAIAAAVREAYRPKAEAAQAEGRKRGGPQGGRGKRKPSGQVTHKVSAEASRTGAVAALGAGMSRRTLEKAAAVVASGDSALIAEMDRTGRVNGVFRKLKIAEQATAIAKEPPPLPTGRFRVLVVDPPWHYCKRPNDPSQRGATPYQSMSIEQIAALPVAKHAENDSVLWLWTTNAHLHEAFHIAEVWGFQFKTVLTWVKNRIGTGDWLRGQTEHCLFCVRGKPVVTLGAQSTLLAAPARNHSRKPEDFYRLVESLCPGSKAEWFARECREGWDCWGAEVGHGEAR